MWSHGLRWHFDAIGAVFWAWISSSPRFWILSQWEVLGKIPSCLLGRFWRPNRGSGKIAINPKRRPATAPPAGSPALVGIDPKIDTDYIKEEFPKETYPEIYSTSRRRGASL